MLALSCLSGLLSGCSIENLVAEDAKIETHMYQEEPRSDDPVDIFIADCNKCIRGDVELFPKLVEIYYSSFTPSTQYATGQFKYQQIEPTSAFEKCAEKAHTMGNTTAFNQLMIRPARIARTARFFYIQQDYRQGAYWIQRLININGEIDGLQVAGRVFIQDMRTIDIGVRLLEHSARLGNRDARQMLLGLLQPGSSYYQSITQNVLLDDEVPSSNEKPISLDDLPGSNKSQAGLNTTQGENSTSSTESTTVEPSEEQDLSTQSVTAKSPQTSTKVSAKDSTQASLEAASNTNTSTSNNANSEGAGQLQRLNIPVEKRNEQAERIKQLKANADAAAQAASQDKP